MFLDSLQMFENTNRVSRARGENHLQFIAILKYRLSLQTILLSLVNQGFLLNLSMVLAFQFMKYFQHLLVADDQIMQAISIENITSFKFQLMITLHFEQENEQHRRQQVNQSAVGNNFREIPHCWNSLWCKKLVISSSRAC